MKRNPNLKEKYLDGEILFRRYFEMGDAKSISRLTKWATSQGMKSSTGQEPTNMGIWKSMWRWASLKENKELAWEIFHQWNPEETREYWMEFMRETIRSAWQHNTESKYQSFIRKNGWI